MRPSGLHPGVTILELVIAVALLGIASAVAGLAFATADPVPTPDGASARVADARRAALRTGRPVTIRVRVDGAYAEAVALPDGSVVGDAVLGFDRLAGRARDAK